MDYEKLNNLRKAGFKSLNNFAIFAGLNRQCADRRLRNDKIYKAYVQKCIDYNELKEAYDRLMINDRIIDE